MAFDPDAYLAKKQAFDPDKYLASKGQASAEPEVVQEQSPLVSNTDRFKLKAFANSDESMIKYLQQQNPNADVRMINKQIAIKGPGEDKYRVIDPDTGIFSSDFLKDAGDLGYDAVDMLGSNASTSIGAAIGGATTLNPLGALAGAVGGGAAWGAGSEAARQKIGQALGIPQEVDGTDVALSAGFGAASPLVFGQGTTAKGLMKAGGGVNVLRKALGMGTKEITEEAAKELSEKTAKNGLVPYALSKAPDILGFMSGKGGESVRRLSKDIDYVDEVEKNASIASEAERVAKQMGEGFDDKLNQVGGELADAIDQSGKKVSLVQPKEAFNSKIVEMEKLAQEDKSPATQAMINKLKKAYSDLYGEGENEIANEVSGRVARNKQQQMKAYAKFSPMTGVDAAESNADSALRGTASRSYGAMNDSLKEATDGVSSDLKNQYADIANLELALEGSFRNPKTTLNTARAFDKDSQTMTRAYLDRAEKAGVDGAQDFNKFVSAAQWANLPSLANPLQARGIPGAALGGVAGFYLGSNSGLGPGGGTVGGGLGALGGAALMGPKAVKYAVRNAVKASRSKPAQVVKALPKPPPALMSRGLYDYLSDEQN